MNQLLNQGANIHFAGDQSASRTKIKYCLGIDPHQPIVAPFFASELRQRGIFPFLKMWSDHLLQAAFHSPIRVIKTQSACFEAFGAEGFRALIDIHCSLKEMGFISILDAKRGDIGSTMRAYGRFAFEQVGADFLTINPYLGWEAVQALSPWLDQGKGVFAVLLTSNIKDNLVQHSLQKSFKGGCTGTVDAFLNEMGSSSHRDKVGLVIGAQRFESLSEAQLKALSSQWWLVPGVGAQGAQWGDLLAWLRSAKHVPPGMVVPMSRALSGDWSQARSELEDIASWEDYRAWVSSRISAFCGSEATRKA